jgi:hypothetical protein
MSTVITPSKLSVIFAGEDLVAELLDGSKVNVRVRAMPARHLARVMQLADKEAELLDFVCFTPSDGAVFGITLTEVDQDAVKAAILAEIASKG